MSLTKFLQGTTGPCAPSSIGGPRGRRRHTRDLACRRQPAFIAPRILATQFSGVRSSCSQIRTTCQPAFLRARLTRRSLALFVANFSSQNFRRVTGNVACFGQPCQKQPSTKTARRCARNAKSGRPGRGTWRRQPVMPDRRNSLARAISVRKFPWLRTRDITSERFARVKMSAMSAHSVQSEAAKATSRSASATNCGFARSRLSAFNWAR